MRSPLLAAAALAGLLIPPATAQVDPQPVDPHQHHRMAPAPAQVDPHLQHRMAPRAAPASNAAPTSAPTQGTTSESPPAAGAAPNPGSARTARPASTPQDHSAHSHSVGPAGSTYDLRWLDAMVQHHTGALRMSEFVFDTGMPGVGALAKEIWRDQAQEIKAMGQWRRAWYPEAPVHPVVLKPQGDPNAMEDLIPMGPAQIAALRMMTSTPTRSNREIWFLEGMLHHHGGALIMAHDALRKASQPSLKRLAREIILAQRREILQLRRMLQHAGLHKPEYFEYDKLFSLS